MNECIDEWMNVLMNECINESMYQYMNALMNDCIDEWMYQCMNVLMNECINEWIQKWMNWLMGWQRRRERDARERLMHNIRDDGKFVQPASKSSKPLQLKWKIDE